MFYKKETRLVCINLAALSASSQPTRILSQRMLEFAPKKSLFPDLHWTSATKLTISMRELQILSNPMNPGFLLTRTSGKTSALLNTSYILILCDIIWISQKFKPTRIDQLVIKQAGDTYSQQENSFIE